MKQKEEMAFRRIGQIKKIPVDSIIFRQDCPSSHFDVDPDRKPELREQLKNNSSLDAVIVRPLVTEHGEVNELITSYELIQVAFEDGLQEVWAHAIPMTDEEAFFQIARKNAAGDKPWTLVDRGINIGIYKDSQGGEDVEKTFADYARMAGCTRALVTLSHQAATVFNHVTTTDVDLRNTLRQKGTHLCRIYQLNEEHWTPLVKKMLKHSWSVKDVEAEVKQIKKTQSASPTTPARSGEPLSEVSSHTPDPKYAQKFEDAVRTFAEWRMSFLSIANDVNHNWKSIREADQTAIRFQGMQLSTQIDDFRSLLDNGILHWLIAEELDEAMATSDAITNN